MDACSNAQEARQVLRSFRRVLIPVELTPGPARDGEGRGRSRSPRQAKARPRRKSKKQGRGSPRSPRQAKAMPNSKGQRLLPPPVPARDVADVRPPPPPAPARDVADVSDVHDVAWRPENVVEGEESQMPWRPFLKGDWRCTRCGNHNMHWRGYCFGQRGGCRNPRDADFRPGDWYCQCGNYNLYWRTHCNRGKCGRSRANGGEQQPPGL